MAVNRSQEERRNALHELECLNKKLVSHRKDAKNAEITKGNNNCFSSPYNEYFYSCSEDSFA